MHSTLFLTGDFFVGAAATSTGTADSWWWLGGHESARGGGRGSREALIEFMHQPVASKVRTDGERWTIYFNTPLASELYLVLRHGIDVGRRIFFLILRWQDLKIQDLLLELDTILNRCSKVSTDEGRRTIYFNPFIL